MNSVNATDLRTLQIMNSVASQLQLTKTITTFAKREYFRLRKHQKFTNNVLLSAFCFLKVINENNVAISYNELVLCYSKLGCRVTRRNLLQIRLKMKEKIKIKKPGIFIPSFIHQLNNTVTQKRVASTKKITFNYFTKLEHISMKLAKSLTYKERKSSSPRSIAIACIYITDRALARYFNYNQIISQRIIGKYTNISQFTIRDLMYYKFKFIYTEKENELFEWIEKSIARSLPKRLMEVTN